LVPGGPGGAIAGGGRTWETYNLLVSFDSDGNVTNSETVHDKQLIDRFIAMCQEKAFLHSTSLSLYISAGGGSRHLGRSSALKQRSSHNEEKTASARSQ
jgi:hypothetical protein